MTTTTATEIHVGDPTKPIRERLVQTIIVHEDLEAHPVTVASKALLTTAEVAARLGEGSSERTVRAMIDRGDMTAVRINARAWGVAPDVLAAFIESRTSKGRVVTLQKKSAR